MRIGNLVIRTWLGTSFAWGFKHKKWRGWRHYKWAFVFGWISVGSKPTKDVRNG